MDITLITPTGGRPEAFALCEKYVKRQTLKPSSWVVIDDCEPKTVCTMGQTYIRGPRNWEPEVNTQRGNLEVGLKHILKHSKANDDAIFLLEDDDWVSSSYLEVMCSYLKQAHIVGLSNSKYYGLHVPGAKLMGNYAHASLAQTGIRASLIPALIKAVNSGELYFDVQLWMHCRNNTIPLLLLANSFLAVGIKGMPGRAGITGSHRSKDYYLDSSLTKLREWLGADADNYLPYVRIIDGKKKRDLQLQLHEAQRSKPREDRGSTGSIHESRKSTPGPTWPK